MIGFIGRLYTYFIQEFSIRFARKNGWISDMHDIWPEEDDGKT